MQNKKGFTLIEVLLVIVIIAILAAIVLVAVNPAKQIADSNNAQRDSNVNAILNALWQYGIDNSGNVDGADENGVLTDGLAATALGDNVANDIVDLYDALVPAYIADMPLDPTTNTFTDWDDYDTGYEIAKSAANGRITVSAPNAQNGQTISVTR